jgi:hypothetical protein
MNRIEQEQAERMYPVCEEEKLDLITRYKNEGVDWLIPTWSFAVGTIAGVWATLHYDHGLYHLAGMLVVLFCSCQLASRSGHMDGFYQGLKWGKRAGVHQAMDLITHSPAGKIAPQ